jgi:hypothetical protein
MSDKEQAKYEVAEIMNAAMPSLRSLMSRMYASQGGMFGGDRDIYKEAGYPKDISPEMFDVQYRRNGMARRVVNAFPEACWKNDPIIICKDLKFMEAYNKFVKESNLYHYLFRVDKLLGIGRYGVLYLGFNDTVNVNNKVKKGAKLKYMKPLRETNSRIKSLESNLKNENYGRPKDYTVRISGTDEMSTVMSKTVDSSRIIHLVEDIEESDIYGTPRMEPSYNFLIALEMVAAAAGEMYWRNALPGLALNADAEADMTQGKTELNRQITDYIQGLTRVLKLQGIDTKQLAPVVAEPRGVYDVLIAMIAGTNKIPQRILTGSERGELASTSDEGNWNERVRERQENTVTDNFLMTTITRLQEAGVLPKTDQEINIEYKDVNNQSDKEKADVSVKLTEAIVKYSESMAQTVFPLKRFLTDVLNYETEEADVLIKEIDKSLENEDYEGFIEFEKMDTKSKDTLKKSVEDVKVN